MAATAPLHADRGHDRTYTSADRRRSTPDFHRGSLIHGNLNLHPNFHHVDGRHLGTSSPRLLHDLQDAVDRGVEIITINPLRERGLERFINPQAPDEMLTRDETPISSQYHQVKVGGDIAALMGICKALIEADDAPRVDQVRVVAGDDDKPREPSEAASVAFAASMAAADEKHVLDHGFIQEHTAGFEAFADTARGYGWAELEQVSGLARADMEKMARTYACRAAPSWAFP